MDFDRMKRRIFLNGSFWFAVFAILQIRSYFNFKSIHGFRSFYEEFITVLHYCSNAMQNGVFIFLQVEYRVMLGALWQRYQHITNLLR